MENSRNCQQHGRAGQGKMRIWITDDTGKVLLEKKLTGIPLRENAIIDATIEYYNDPYPCVIRRSAVMKTMFSQIEEMLKKEAALPKMIKELPERFSYLVNLPESAAYVSFQD